MIQLSCADILKAVDGKLVSGDLSQRFLSISTDSRNICAGALFIPLIGENFNGHDFIGDAVKADAFGTLASQDTGLLPDGDFTVIRVDDTLKALGLIAGYYRSLFSIPVVAVTGSVGKTGTKELIAAALSRQLKVLKSEANLNNEIGMPQTLLGITREHEAVVLEMGMRGSGEISYLSCIARPDIAVITNIGLAHIERLGSRENILKAKMEILDGLKENGTVILNGDDAMLHGFKDLLPFKTILFGFDESCDYRAENIISQGENGCDFDVKIRNTIYKVRTTMPGMHNVINSLAAIAVASEMGVTPENVIAGISDCVPEKMRQNIISVNGIKIIDDVYNANPYSMTAAMNVLKDISRKGRAIAVLGDMLELGAWTDAAHNEIGAEAFKVGVGEIVAIGEYSANIRDGAVNAGFDPYKIHVFDSNQEAIEFLKSFVTIGDTILVKGSRGMKMEGIVSALTSNE